MQKYTAIYFHKSATIFKKHLPREVITMQFFQRHNDAIFCGIREVLALLKKHTNTARYAIRYLQEGAVIQAQEPVLELEGHYQDFGIFEGVIDGILTRATSLATNARDVVRTTSKPIIFMGDRADHYINQEQDGYAISVGGISTQVTTAQVALHAGVAIGTLPHVLIQACQGSITRALRLYHQTYPQEQLVALVDFNNDVIGDALQALAAFKQSLGAIRLDTAGNLKDKMFQEHEHEYGVTPQMVTRVRQALDEHGGSHVKIIISSGLTASKIRAFEIAKAPVDMYGVGAALLQVRHHFTADAVKLNGKCLAKVGRAYQPSSRLITLA